MSKQSLAVKWRPTEFEDVSSQKAVIDILKNQIETGEISRAYLFSGASGCGKTTLAKIFASKINNTSNPDVKVIDAALHNGKEDMEAIISDAKQRSVISKYKILILDECHMLTSASQNSLLTLLEDCPESTIFIFCTTDPQKLLPTVISRLQHLKITKISVPVIKDRLKYICEQEKINANDSALQYLAQLGNGSMRQAISLLDTCSTLLKGKELTTENIISTLGSDDVSTNADLLFNIYDSMTNENAEHRMKSINLGIQIIEEVSNDGRDIKDFINQFFAFVLDCTKYLSFGKSFLNTKLPNSPQLKKDLDLYDINTLLILLGYLRTLKKEIKYDQDPVGLIEGFLYLRRDK